jgi:hypothetical protein
MSIEQDIRDLTVAIRNLTIALNNQQSRIPFENEPVIKILEEVAADLTVEPNEDEILEQVMSRDGDKPKAKPAKKAVEPEIKLISREELQSKCTALVRSNREIKVKLIDWLKDKGASSLVELEAKYLSDFNDFVESVK